MAAVATFTFGTNSAEFTQGSLHHLPTELATASQREAYRSAPLGWSTCPLGYSVFKFALLEEQVAIPGVRLPGGGKPRRRFPGYACEHSREAIESLAKEIKQQGDKVDERVNEFVTKITHDLRKVSSQIVNFVELLKTSLIKQNYLRAEHQAENISASQQMLSLRLDMMDYTTGLAFEVPPDAIPVYKKFDKIAKMFASSAEVNGVSIRLNGPSVGYTMGPPVFELVPFVLVENAVKYSPRNGPIELKVTDFSDRIDAHVRSFGPKIDAREMERIFEHGFRGKHAQQSGKSGSGIGLHAAMSLAKNSFGGSLKVHQDLASINMDGTEVWATTFSLSVLRVS